MNAAIGERARPTNAARAASYASSGADQEVWTFASRDALRR